MTKIEEIEQRLEVMEQVAKAYRIFKEEVEQCQKALAELKESKKEGKWKPAIGEDFWHRDESGLIACCHFTEYNQYNRWMADNIPIFPTKEACEKYWHFMDTVKEKSYEFSKEEWEDRSVPKYYIYYVPISNGFIITYELSQKNLGGIYFKTMADAQYIIDNFKDELMEYFV